MRWPIAVGVGLLIVVLVNATMIVIAVQGADPVVATYTHGPR